MEPLFSKTIKSGKTTYFVDVKEAKNQKKYISISESTLTQEGEETKFNRKSIIVFENAAEQLRDAIEEAAKIVTE